MKLCGNHCRNNVSGGYGVATGGPLAWGLCYNKELSPDKFYCDEYYKLTYPCTPGAAYYGRGAIPLYWLVRSIISCKDFTKSGAIYSHDQTKSLCFCPLITGTTTTEKLGKP